MRTKSRKSNGEGSIYFSEKDGCWRAEITWFDGGGVRRRKCWGGQKQSEVRAKLNEFKKQLLTNGKNMTTESRTFQQFSEEWLAVVLKPKLKPTSYDRKVCTLKSQVYKHIGAIPIDRLNHSQIQKMVNDISDSGLSYSTVKKAYEAVSGCLKYYRIKTSTSFNPCEGITLPELKRREASDIRYFTDTERKLIVDEATRTFSNGVYAYRLGWAFVLLMYSGLRAGELCALTWSDINFYDKTIRVNKNAVEYSEWDEEGVSHSVFKTQNSTKTRSGMRIIPMTQKALTALKELKEITGNYEYIITSSNGNRIRPSRLGRTFASILMAIGMERVGLHALRHTFATMLFNNGCEVKVVSELLGHSNTKITENIYIHVIQQQRVKAIQSIDKFSD